MSIRCLIGNHFWEDHGTFDGEKFAGHYHLSACRDCGLEQRFYPYEWREEIREGKGVRFHATQFRGGRRLDSPVFKWGRWRTCYFFGCARETCAPNSNACTFHGPGGAYYEYKVNGNKNGVFEPGESMRIDVTAAIARKP